MYILGNRILFYVKDRGQFVGVSSLCYYVGSRELLQVIRFGSKHIYLMNYPVSSVIYSCVCVCVFKPVFVTLAREARGHLQYPSFYLGVLFFNDLVFVFKR